MRFLHLSTLLYLVTALPHQLGKVEPSNLKSIEQTNPQSIKTTDSETEPNNSFEFLAEVVSNSILCNETPLEIIWKKALASPNEYHDLQKILWGLEILEPEEKLLLSVRTNPFNDLKHLLDLIPKHNWTLLKNTALNLIKRIQECGCIDFWDRESNQLHHLIGLLEIGMTI